MGSGKKEEGEDLDELQLENRCKLKPVLKTLTDLGKVGFGFGCFAYALKLALNDNR
jgi:hypothetical protein